MTEDIVISSLPVSSVNDETKIGMIAVGFKDKKTGTGGTMKVLITWADAK